MVDLGGPVFGDGVLGVAVVVVESEFFAVGKVDLVGGECVVYVVLDLCDVSDCSVGVAFDSAESMSLMSVRACATVFSPG